MIQSAAQFARGPGDPDGWFSLAIVLTNERRFDEAIAAFGIAAAQDPGLVDAHTNMALLHFL